MSEGLHMTIEEIYDHFPKDIPQEFFDDIDVKAKPHYLWIMKKQELYCDNCGRKFDADEIHDIVKHNHKYRCPYCHREMLARKIGVTGHNPAKRCALTYHFGRSIIDKDVITCMAIFTAYGYSNTEKPWETAPFRSVDALYVFVPGKGTAYANAWKIYPSALRVNEKGRYYYRGIYRSPYTSELSMEVRKRIRECDTRYINCMSIKPENYVCVFEANFRDVAKVAKDTQLKYVTKAYREIITDVHDAYAEGTIYTMDKMVRYPVAVELIAKMGIGRALYQMLRFDESAWHIFNLRGKDIRTIFRGQVTKADKKYLYEHGHAIKTEALEAWQKLRRVGSPVPLEDVAKLFKDVSLARGYVVNELIDVMNEIGASPKKVFKYVTKQKQLYKCTAVVSTYFDYLEDCKKLSEKFHMGNVYNLQDKSILYPQNLEQAHQMTIELIHMETDRRRVAKLEEDMESLRKKLAQLEKKYQKIKPELEKKYSFHAMGYAIVVPPELADLHREGIMMHNCVAGYKDRVALGKTQVVYIRKEEDMDTSFGTMEISPENEEIIQARGKFNRNLPGEADAFVKKFEHDVLEPLRDASIKIRVRTA